MKCKEILKLECDPREVFNTLLCSSVEAMGKTKSGRKNLKWISEHKTLDRESISSLLWESFRALKHNESLGCGNLEVYKKQSKLFVEVISSRNPKKVFKTFIIETRPNKETKEN